MTWTILVSSIFLHAASLRLFVDILPLLSPISLILFPRLFLFPMLIFKIFFQNHEKSRLITFGCLLAPFWRFCLSDCSSCANWRLVSASICLHLFIVFTASPYLILNLILWHLIRWHKAWYLELTKMKKSELVRQKVLQNDYYTTARNFKMDESRRSGYKTTDVIKTDGGLTYHIVGEIRP